MYNKNKFEGDISGISRSNNRVAVIARQRLWPNGRIPYAIVGNYDTRGRAAIAAAITEYNRKTCIRIVPRTSSDANYVRIVDGDGCSSFIGRIGRGAQELSLDRNNCMQHGTIVHEFMHAVGFWHEQSRPDRDQYVRIRFENIEDDAIEGNFEKRSTQEATVQSTPYDYFSVMHYPPTIFSKNNQPTMVALRNTNGRQIGLNYNLGLTAIDTSEVNMLYNCRVSGK